MRTISTHVRSALATALLLVTVSAVQAATSFMPPTSDPSYGLPIPVIHPMPPPDASWIWAKTVSDNQNVLFRRSFSLVRSPARANLSITADDFFTLYVNGQEVDKSVPDPKNNDVWQDIHNINVARYLQSGKNTLAVEGTNAGGAAGLVARLAIPGEPAVATDASWKVYPGADEPAGWTEPSYNDGAWVAATVEAPVDGGVWASAGGLDDWPGYGAVPYLAHLARPADWVLDIHPGAGRIAGAERLAWHSSAVLTVWPSADPAGAAPSLLLDFGQEVSGRVVIHPLTAGVVVVGTGESQAEANNSPWGGAHSLSLSPGEMAATPYSAFRYARLVFPSTAGSSRPYRMRVALDFRYYPVTYKGSFDCSGPLLTKIWYTGAYTAHLCMQQDIWDAPKRDRARWSGDLNVSGGVIDDVFADRFLMEQTLDRLRADAQGGRPANALPSGDVNGIPGYSAAWFCTVADLYRHVGDKAFVTKEHAAILSLAQYDAGEFDSNHLFVNPHGAWTFVDWSPGLDSDTPAARATTDMFLIRGIREAAFLLKSIGDSGNAAKWDRWADTAAAAARHAYADPAAGTYGDRLQENTMAIYSGVATPAQTAAIYRLVLDPKSGAWDHTGVPPYNDGVITPYYGNYVLRAMADAGQTLAGENLLRRFWGGMLAEGATTFWEAYDPHWLKTDFHENLYADGNHGYYVSLCHGWSSGPTSWLTEQVLGVRPTSGGFATVVVAPDLGDLKWAIGDVPTPRGILHVVIRRLAGGGLSLRLLLPPGTTAEVDLPAGRIRENGKPASAAPGPDGRLAVTVRRAGNYFFTSLAG